jgi:hypothetical protein
VDHGGTAWRLSIKMIPRAKLSCGSSCCRRRSGVCATLQWFGQAGSAGSGHPTSSPSTVAAEAVSSPGHAGYADHTHTQAVRVDLRRPRHDAGRSALLWSPLVARARHRLPVPSRPVHVRMCVPSWSVVLGLVEGQPRALRALFPSAARAQGTSRGSVGKRLT